MGYIIILKKGSIARAIRIYLAVSNVYPREYSMGLVTRKDGPFQF